MLIMTWYVRSVQQTSNLLKKLIAVCAGQIEADWSYESRSSDWNEVEILIDRLYMGNTQKRKMNIWLAKHGQDSDQAV